ncbi:MAG: hypothetical protein DWQ34_20380 [Planctomycetota bacterium]|nr:MAG: hypothetical protein DWQ29_10425 [Planctomycetota bacterium]REJ89119.1 MAG: hypothetical protein DWQ34_20380 [Planctomycetota bacterium]REK29786.1 MAG: hypothetical protein DWQ41_03915 [Planctomycetota bacterium]REK30394.1 MAG: hypothetical protein DWQ45_21120 [Planctomycetota bacterium]
MPKLSFGHRSGLLERSVSERKFGNEDSHTTRDRTEASAAGFQLIVVRQALHSAEGQRGRMLDMPGPTDF